MKSVKNKKFVFQCQQDSPMLMSMFDSWPPHDDALEIIKQNRKVCSGFLAITEDTRFFFKKFSFIGWSGVLRRLTGKNRAVNNWTISWLLLRHNVNVPLPQALITEPKASWYICAALDKAISLQKAIQDADNDTTTWILCMNAIEQLVRMHEANVVHGDFKWDNVLVLTGGCILITDLDSARLKRSIGPDTAASDLARFLVNGLEMGLDQEWAHAIICRYAAERRLPATAFSGLLCSSIERISRKHQRKYGRKSVCLAPMTIDNRP
jgi:tRNA A-37 threonylcarbamoyl transferase component Bud32